MAFSACKNVIQLTSGFLKLSRNVSSAVMGFHSATSFSRHMQTHRSFTRSMWSLCSRRPTGIISSSEPCQVAVGAKWNKTCGCCGLHTTGDQELAEFLSEELEHEKKTAVSGGKLPKIKGFDVSVDGSEVVLTREADGEKISLEMNINHSVQDASGTEYEEQPQGQENDAAEMVAHPPFTVKINKGGDLTLAIQCEFPEQDGFQPAAEGQEGGYEDAIEITEVAMLRGEWDDKIYAVSGSVMDGNLYDMLMNMMEERGITGQCVDEIVDYATAYDQQKYIQFLEDLQSFAKAK